MQPRHRPNWKLRRDRLVLTRCAVRHSSELPAVGGWPDIFVENARLTLIIPVAQRPWPDFAELSFPGKPT